MISARELVFYIRAEDQASRVVKRAAQSFGSMSKISGLQKQADQLRLTNARKYASVQQSIARNEQAILRAQAQSSRLNRYVAAGRPVKGYTVDETMKMAQAASMQVSTLRRQEQLLAQDLDEVRRSGDAASAALDRQISAAKINRVESYIGAVQNLARALRLVGIAGAAGLGFAAHQAATFGSQVTLAASQARQPGAPATQTLQIQSKLQDQILKQMQKFPATSQEMADAYYQIFSGTNIQSTKEATKYVTLFNQAAVGGGASLAEMTQAGITLKNVFGVGGPTAEFKNMTQALNVFFSAVRYGRMTASQFANALGYITPIAKDVHLSFKNVAEDMAFFTRQTGGRMTRQDAQGLARLIQLFSRQDVVTGLAQKGIPVFDKLTGRMRPVVDIIKQIHDQLKLTPQETVNFFKTISAAGSGKQGTQGTIQAIRIFSQGIQNAKAYEEVVNNVRQDNNEFTKSFQALSKSPGVQWQVFINQFKSLVLVIGREAIPAFIQLGQPIAKILQYFNSLSVSTKRRIAEIGVFGSVGLALGGTLVIIAGAVGKLVLTLKLLKLESLASEAGSVAVKSSILLAALVALGYILIKYPNQVHAVVNAMGGLKGVLTAIGIAAAGFTLSKVVSSIGLVGSEALTAEGRVNVLRGSLLKLSAIAIPAILIPVGLKIDKSLQTGTKPGTPIANFGGGILGGIKKIGGAIEYGVDRAIGMSPSQARASTIKDIGQKLYLGPKSALDALVQIDKNPLTSNEMKVAAHRAFSLGQYGTVQKILAASKKLKIATNIQPADLSRGNLLSLVDKVPVAIRQAASQPNWNRLFQNVVKLDKVVSDGKVHTLAEYKALDDAEDKLQKASTGNQYQAAQQMLSSLESTWNKAETATKRHADKIAKMHQKVIKDNVKNAKTELGNLLQGVESMYQNILSTNQTEFGQLFQGPVVTGARVQDILQFGGKVSGTDLLKDIKGQVFQFNQLNNQLNTLSKRGAPKEFIDQVRQLGPDARDDIKALLQLTPAQFKQYVAAWQKGQDSVKKATENQLTSQIKIYEQHGKAIARAIIKGIQSQDQKLQGELQKIIYKMFPGLAKQARITSAGQITSKSKFPSAHPNYKEPRVPHVPRATVSSRPKRGLASAGIHIENLNITAPVSEHANIKTQLKHGAFNLRNMFGGNT